LHDRDQHEEFPVKRMPPPPTLGFRLSIAPIVDERDQQRKIRISLETVQSFSSFVYELSVEERREGNTLRYKVLGLKPPQLSIPASGRAKYERVYDDVVGPLEITVEGLDGNTNTFAVRVAENAVTILKSPPAPFTELVI
jgi:hypothetical protein